MPTPDFAPLSHEELRELWNDHKDHHAAPNSPCAERRRFILSAIWWEGVNDKRSHNFSTFCRYDENLVPICLTTECCHKDWTDEQWFLLKLREVGIDWREDG